MKRKGPRNANSLPLPSAEFVGITHRIPWMESNLLKDLRDPFSLLPSLCHPGNLQAFPPDLSHQPECLSPSDGEGDAIHCADRLSVRREELLPIEVFF